MNSAVQINSKLPNAGPSIFATMSGLARSHNALNLSQGFPSFDCHPELTALVAGYMKKGFNQYAPMPGMPELRKAIAAKTQRLYGAEYDPETEITVTAGATQALFTAIAALVKAGDEVIVFAPAYDSYGPSIELAGGTPVYAELRHPDYSIDWEEVKELVTDKTRMIIVNTPHNPSGALLNTEDIRQLTMITDNTNIIVLSDEVYEHIVFDGAEHHSMIRYPKLAGRSVVISSFGKTYHTTGWKMGYCIAPAAITAEIRKVHQFNVFSVNTPIQLAYAEFLEREDLYTGLNDFYQQKRDYFLQAIEGSGFEILPARGTYFQLLGFASISDKSDVEFANELTIKHKLASIPVSVFYPTLTDHKVLRFCFAKDEATLDQAGEIIRSL